MKKLWMAGIILFTLLAATHHAYAAETPSGIPLSELEQFVDDFMAEFIGNTVAGASVIVIEGGQVALTGHYGFADLETGLLVSDDTVFEWGSVGKLLVWVSAMQLAEQGRLDLTADIRTYLPEGFFNRLQFEAPITFYHLMNHNSGWGVVATDLLALSPSEIGVLDEALQTFEPKQQFEPGSIVAYSNYGVAVAGYIIERLAGQPFYQYVMEHIFLPLGMNETTTHPYQADHVSVMQKRELIRGHEVRGDSLKPSPVERTFTSFYPAGGTIGTVNDLALFMMALLDDSTDNPLFSNTETLERLLSNSWEITDGFPGIAHGFMEGFFGDRTLGHMGTMPAFTANFRFVPDRGFGVIVLTNSGSHELGGRLMSSLLGDFNPVFYSEPLPDLSNLQNIESQFFLTANATTGFARFINSIPTAIIELKDDQTLNLMGFEFEQIRPYVLYGTFQGLGAFAHLNVANNQVATITVYQSGRVPAVFVPVSGLALMRVNASLGLIIVSGIFVFLSSIILPISLIRDRRKKKDIPAVKKLAWVLNVFGISVFINYLMMASKFPIVSHRQLLPNFIFNIAYMILAPLCAIFILGKLKKSKSSKVGKMLYVISGIFAICLSLLMLIWEMYT